jgi:YidC/Oxa1 family membrane protein insertase
MEKHRLLVYFTLFFISYLLWAQWQMDYGPKTDEVATIATDSPVSVAYDDKSGSVPLADVPETRAQNKVKSEAEPVLGASRRIKIITDFLEAEIDTRGGD